MGLKVNNTDAGEDKPTVDFGNWGRPIASGKYLCAVSKIEDEVMHKTDPSLVGIKVTLRTVNASPEKAPDGQVKIDWYVYPKSDAVYPDSGKLLSDGSAMTQFAKAFDPRILTPEGCEIIGANYRDRECFAYISWNPTAGKDGKGKAFINRVEPKPGNQAPPKDESAVAADAGGDGESPF